MNVLVKTWKNLVMDLPHWGTVIFNNVLRKPKVIFVGEKYRVKKGALLCANHSCFNDPLILHTVFWYRRLYFMAGELTMRNKLTTKLLGDAGCLKVDRNISDIEAVNNVTDHLKADCLVGIFPQGKILRDESMEAIKSGAILMALRADKPLIPIYLSPKKHFFTHRRVVIGQPIDCKAYCTKKLPSMKDIEVLTELLFDKMWECRKVYEDECQSAQSMNAGE